MTLGMNRGTLRRLNHELHLQLHFLEDKGDHLISDFKQKGKFTSRKHADRIYLPRLLLQVKKTSYGDGGPKSTA